MSRTLVLALFLFFSFGLLSQSISESDPAFRELGLRFSGFDDFNLFYKKALGPDKVRRHRLLLGRITYGSNSSELDLSLGYAIGTEKRKPIADDLYFIYGLEYTMAVAANNRENNLGTRNTQLRLIPSIGFVLGFQLDFSDRYCLTAEIIPSVGGNYSYFNYTDNQFKIEALLNTNTTALSLMYRF